jgi:hypothetical protein
MRPVSVTEALKGSNVFHRNRYEVLRPRTNSVAEKIADNFRGRSNSVKRKASCELTNEGAKKISADKGPAIEPQVLDAFERRVETLKTLSRTLNEEAAKVKVDPGLEKIIKCICEFMDVSVLMHGDFVKSCTVQTPPEIQIETDDSDPDQGSEPDPDRDRDRDVFTQYSQVAARKTSKPKSTVQRPPPKAPKDPKLQAFQDAVKHAERSTLIFNLDLGQKKTLNEKTILSQSALALSAAAAEVEGNKGKTPTKESISALDDVMSVTQNVTLFGRVTKAFENKKNPQDPRNRTFFTMPIKYEFKDRDTRIEAESILRDTCKIDCATPYPVILRQCIKQVVDHFRAEYPNDYVKVYVDTEKLVLNVARKVKGRGWFDHSDPIPLPPEVLDIRARFAPKDFKLNGLPVLCNQVRNPLPSQERDMEEF